MRKYIDSEETIKQIREDYKNLDVPEEWSKGINFAIGRILRQPTADVTQVVRCKDCKHHIKIFHADKRRKDGGYFIYGCDLVDGYSPACLDDDYCSAGERNE